MKTCDPNDPLAQWADQRLRQWPDRPAPRSLLPAVMAAVRRRSLRPWYEHPWLEWPRRMQIASLTGLILSIGLFCSAVRLGWSWLVSHPSTDLFLSAASALLGAVQSLRYAVVLGIQAIPPGWWIGAGLSGFVVWLSCLGIGTLCWRLLISGRTSRFKSMA